MKYAIQYLRIEKQIYTFNVEANSKEEAIELASDEFFNNEYKVVHAEEYIHSIALIKD